MSTEDHVQPTPAPTQTAAPATEEAPATATPATEAPAGSRVGSTEIAALSMLVIAGAVGAIVGIIAWLRGRGKVE